MKLNIIHVIWYKQESEAVGFVWQFESDRKMSFFFDFDTPRFFLSSLTLFI